MRWIFCLLLLLLTSNSLAAVLSLDHSSYEEKGILVRTTIASLETDWFLAEYQMGKPLRLSLAHDWLSGYVEGELSNLSLTHSLAGGDLRINWLRQLDSERLDLSWELEF